MIRENLSAGSRHFSLVVSTAGWNKPQILQYIWRYSQSGNSDDGEIQFTDPQVWLKVTRNSNSFSAYYRPINGQVWNLLGTRTFAAWTSTAYVGMAVTSHDNGKYARLSINYFTTNTTSDSLGSANYHNIRGPFCQGYCSAIEDEAVLETILTNEEKIDSLTLDQGVRDLSTVSTKSPTCFPQIKTVKLQQTTSEALQIFELEVLDRVGSNVAKGKKATSSSSFHSSPESNAVDGNLTTLFHCQPGDPAPWLNINLESSFEAQKIVIHNRWCDDVNDV